MFIEVTILWISYFFNSFRAHCLVEVETWRYIGVVVVWKQVVRRCQAAVLPHCRTSGTTYLFRPWPGALGHYEAMRTCNWIVCYSVSRDWYFWGTWPYSLPYRGNGCTCTVGNQAMSSLETPTSFLALFRKDMDISSFMTWYMVYGMYISSSRLDNHINWETFHWTTTYQTLTRYSSAGHRIGIAIGQRDSTWQVTQTGHICSTIW